MPYCDRCDRHFSNWSALDRHERDSLNHHICHTCGLDFPTPQGLKEHFVQSPKHHYCQYCDLHLDDEYDWKMHVAESHYRCFSCNRVFKNEIGLKEHYVQSPEHHYCQYCDIHLDNEYDWGLHMNKIHNRCPPCNRVFKNEIGLKEHFRQSPVHHYCVDCNRHFKSASNLDAHLRSSVHCPKTIICPFQGCGQGFVSRSALILHLEGGACRAGVNRALIDRAIRQLDTKNVITNPRFMITNGDDNVRYSATAASWNGRSYECYLCHNGYRTLAALNQHLGSPRHADKNYRCPLGSCSIHFTTLSALFQHIESQRCGVHRFTQYRAVENIFDRVVAQHRLTA